MKLPNCILNMQRRTKIGLVVFVILVCVILLTLVLNYKSIAPAPSTCVKLDGGETCHSTSTNEYRFYGTKTAYDIARQPSSEEEFDIKGCEPKVFYLLSRHATRYPDEEDIEEMIKVLPVIQEKINISSRLGKTKLCVEDLKRLQDWLEQLKPEYGNRLSPNGVLEAVELGRRYKARFPTILGQKYSPEKFVFQFTSRERTLHTAEAFSRGLFNENAKNINFNNGSNGINDDVLQFHKECKVMQKKCSDPNFDTSEIDKFEDGPLMNMIIESVSERVGFPLKYGEIKLIYKACVFGYAVRTGDIWCSFFSTDELKVLEFGGDIDDYYKDSYGNKINYEQACPAVQYIMNLFESYDNTSEPKAVLQFSHAGGIKKVISRFHLFEDDKPLKANKVCSAQNRKWQSSIIAPFLTNLALVLYDCGNENKIMAFHNEKPIKLGGCKDELCSYHEFFEKYHSIAENCDMTSICCTCCIA